MGRNSLYQLRLLEERSVPLGPITLLSDSEGFIKGLSNQRSSGNIFRGVVQKI